ncbi:hypothetical protein Gasu2_68560 [Galdieria sulphuraria]|uniref:Large ribosomal subunit protein mL53 n=1 Tax=Galdieria sulphuraria TaxID=130081 RepID=M2W1R7_GALSU|nr:uncharacterized protein Gasu_30580 [Galdieria sulphuraria]EME29621.1 hypothetical protein Gasu_30580 [Galdieria sulphuraria]GJD12785.1 hypothetical protein Gasu2_68560 [Galdieria sulphuraria]|eukprot:XP_005706141.1 hypothetical protein Gasu_30580 [Galdieria sulphuraria]
MKFRPLSKLQKTLAQYRKPEILFRPISKATVSFDPFDSNSASTREFLFHLRSRKVEKQLPNLLTEVKLYEKGESPSVKLEYVDGTEQHLVTSSMSLSDIISAIEQESRWKGESIKTPSQLIMERRKRSTSS